MFSAGLIVRLDNSTVAMCSSCLVHWGDKTPLEGNYMSSTGSSLQMRAIAPIRQRLIVICGRKQLILCLIQNTNTAKDGYTFIVLLMRPFLFMKPLNILILTMWKEFMFIFSVPCRQESMTFEIIVVTGVISGGRMGQNCREDLSKLLCQLLFICNWIARGSTSR